MRDDFRAQGLQSMYHAGAVGALNALAEECTRIAFVLVKTICKRKSLRFSREKMEEYAHDAAALVIARYLRCPDYSIRKFYSALWNALQEVIFDGHRRKQKSFEQAQSSISDYNADLAECIEIVNPSTALDELVSDNSKGKRIAIDLSRSTSYAKAIRRIAAYVEREWIYANAAKLHSVFKTMRWRPNTKSRISKTRSGRISHKVLRGQQAEHEQPVQRASSISER